MRALGFVLLQVVNFTSPIGESSVVGLRPPRVRVYARTSVRVQYRVTDQPCVVYVDLVDLPSHEDLPRA